MKKTIWVGSASIRISEAVWLKSNAVLKFATIVEMGLLGISEKNRCRFFSQGKTTFLNIVRLLGRVAIFTFTDISILFSTITKMKLKSHGQFC